VQELISKTCHKAPPPLHCFVYAFTRSKSGKEYVLGGSRCLRKRPVSK